MKVEVHHALLGAAVVLVVAAIAGGLYVMGSPSEARARGLDEHRVRDLQQVEAAVNVYWNRNRRIPASLDELNAVPGLAVSILDPVTGARYDYTTREPQKYELCAQFERASDSSPSFWSHPAGRQCFNLTVRMDVVR